MTNLEEAGEISTPRCESSPARNLGELELPSANKGSLREALGTFKIKFLLMLYITKVVF